jgi:hypothetical protein
MVVAFGLTDVNEGQDVRDQVELPERVVTVVRGVLPAPVV